MGSSMGAPAGAVLYPGTGGGGAEGSANDE